VCSQREVNVRAQKSDCPAEGVGHRPQPRTQREWCVGVGLQRQEHAHECLVFPERTERLHCRRVRERRACTQFCVLYFVPYSRTPALCFARRWHFGPKRDIVKKNAHNIEPAAFSVKSCVTMASDEDYDSMEELALVQDMSQKIESGMQRDGAQAPKPKARKPKAGSANPADLSLEDKIAAREKQIQENEIKMLHIEISIQKAKTNLSKIMFALTKLDPNIAKRML
jgi:hypothetical protein